MHALGGTAANATHLTQQIYARYTEPHRAYHGASHVTACLQQLDSVDTRNLADCMPEVECAIWLHDIVYDTHASDNEEQSAALAQRELRACGVPANAIERIAVHILATKTHIAQNNDTILVLDIDLSILGAPATIYAGFEAQIRNEYSWVPERHYCEGRKQVLKRFLAREHIYGTAHFRTQYEAQARVNLAAAIANLERRGTSQVRQ